MKVIRDAVHGDIELYPEEMRLIHTPGFQRLHGCRQLGLTHLVYPCAKHARFEHVLGVMFVATQIAARLKISSDFFAGSTGGELERVLRFAALLHDMGHVPFGHTFEDEMPFIHKHDKPSPNGSSRMERAVSQVLQESGNEKYIIPVLQVLLAIAESSEDDRLYPLVDQGKIKSEYLVIADIVGNTICADLLDYIKRDHLMTGIRAAYDERIFRYFGVDKHSYRGKTYSRVVIRLVKNGRVRGDCLADLLDILKLRYNLSDKVLFHPQKCAADAMLIKAVAPLGLSEDELMKFSDDGLLDKLQAEPLVEMIRRREVYKAVFWCSRDDISSYSHEPKEDLIEKLHVDGGLRTRIEHGIEQELNLPPQSVLVFCPGPKMTMKLIRTLVEWKDGTIRRLNEIRGTDDHLVAQQISILQDIYPQLWKLYLFVRPKLRSRGRKIQEKFCAALKKELHLNASCNQALQHYLDGGCPDYQLGCLLDEELEANPRFGTLAPAERVRAWSASHAKLPQDLHDDVYAEPELALEKRDEPQALRLIVKKIVADGPVLLRIARCSRPALPTLEPFAAPNHDLRPFQGTRELCREIPSLARTILGFGEPRPC